MDRPPHVVQALVAQTPGARCSCHPSIFAGATGRPTGTPHAAQPCRGVAVYPVYPPVYTSPLPRLETCIHLYTFCAVYPLYTPDLIWWGCRAHLYTPVYPKTCILAVYLLQRLKISLGAEMSITRSSLLTDACQSFNASVTSLSILAPHSS